MDKKANIIMFLAILATSTGSIFAKAADAPALVTAAYRLGLASIVLVPWAMLHHREDIKGLTSKDWIYTVISGGALAIHFASWISALQYISIASCVVLVNTSPLWVALAAPFITGDRIDKKTAMAISLAVVGAVIIGWGDFSTGPDAWKGDGLALLGAISLTVYLLLGRKVRAKVSLMPYVAVCYGSAAAFLWVALMLSSLPVSGYSWHTWGALWGMALIPQILGHSAYNWALRWVNPAVVAVMLLGEPIGSSVMAWAFFHEVPGPAIVLGGCFILIGIYMTQRNKVSPAPAKATL
ncbi:DMT family transporter [Dethiosulfovibrio salsuginis]|uniref:Permease of the drug/metabolite transporter (DMT) superfamily n=1 Tax=Dethiosulfovibrio salsuginis TaxID=561720 RepID=A0A1X7KF45_9BACT|nr:DMT family transporter [Dethiosulfovibrio salsuginis]SMG39515.1 Permease of the drug/metabolite transporter (DMT) superfamily [Dethiosulfovibrio salsuginis]